MAASSRYPPWPDLMPVACWTALLVGLVEGILYQVPPYAAYLLRQNLRSSLHAVWMVPALNLTLFCLAALVLLVLAKQLAWLRGFFATAAVFALGLFCLALLATRVHRVAGAVVALGLGLAAARLAARAPEVFGRLVHRTLPVLTLAFLTLSVGLPAWESFREGRAIRRLPAAASGAVNILLIVLDTARDFNFSFAGYGRPTTPLLAARATQGTRFGRALSTSPWTLPSHGSMFTGRLAGELSSGFRRPLNGAHPTVAEVLAAHGYITAGFVANLPYASRPLGLGRGFLHYEDFPISVPQAITSSALGRFLNELCSRTVRDLLQVYQPLVYKPAAAVRRDVLTWLEARREQRPYFVFLNLYDAHHPYVAPAPWRGKFQPDSLQPFRPTSLEFRKMSARDIVAEHNAYDGALAYLDHEIGGLLNDLDQRGALSNTLVILTSDHGEQFGEHNRVSHGNSLYRELLQVPLVLWHPTLVPTARVIETPVSLRDLPQTMLDLAGISDGRLPGRSLARHWRDSATGAEPLFAELIMPNGVAMRAVVDSGLHYIRNYDGREELYDFEGDPGATLDLLGADHAAYAPVLARMRRLAVWTLGPDPPSPRRREDVPVIGLLTHPGSRP